VGTAKRQRQKAGRQARLAAQETAVKRKQSKRRGITIVVALAVFLAVAFLISVLVGGDDEETVATGDSTTTTIDELAATSTSVDDSASTTAADTEADAFAYGTTACPPAEGTAERLTTFDAPPAQCIDPAKTYTATVTTTKGAFTIALDAAGAPGTVNNFVFLARNHFYDGVAFHRIIPGFVVQGGDANGDPPGTGDPGYSFADELPEAGAYKIGSVAMANSGADTNGSQFFVVSGDDGASLPPQYSLFGEVTEGLDVIAAIEATGTPEGTPSEETTIESVTITES
jgi:cyclophilin family peptidyl-prolyl cis-trans isomerase